MNQKERLAQIHKMINNGFLVCNTCHAELPLNCFNRRNNNKSPFRLVCKKCVKARTKAKMNNNDFSSIDINIEIKPCVKCKKGFTLKNFAKCLANKDGRGNLCYSCRQEYQQKHYYENRSKLLEQKRTFLYDKRQNDPEYVLKLRTKRLFAIRFKQWNIPKQKPFFKYTGIHIDEYMNHFRDDPYFNDLLSGDSLHIDHIIPISIYNFNNLLEIKKAWNPRNLRLIPSEENKIKSNKILWDLIEKYKIYDLLPDSILNKKEV